MLWRFSQRGIAEEKIIVSGFEYPINKRLAFYAVVGSKLIGIYLVQ